MLDLSVGRNQPSRYRPRQLSSEFGKLTIAGVVTLDGRGWGARWWGRPRLLLSSTFFASLLRQGTFALALEFGDEGHEAFRRFFELLHGALVCTLLVADFGEELIFFQLLLLDFPLFRRHLGAGLLQLIGTRFHGSPCAFEGREVTTVLLQQAGVVLHELDREADPPEEIGHVSSGEQKRQIGDTSLLIERSQTRMQISLTCLQLLAQLVHLLDQCGMLFRLELEVALIGLQFTPFLLEQAVAVFEGLHQVALVPLGLI